MIDLNPKAWEAARDVFLSSWGYSPDDFLGKAITAYLAASPSPPALDGAGREGWQPIETAPKDGTRVLLAAPGHLTMIGSFEAWKTIHAAGPWWWSNGSMITPDPTHWQPLPAPPKETR